MNTSAKLKQLNRIRRLSRLMDTAFKIPGLGLKVGLDPIIGLVPFAGDAITTGTSAYIIYLATQFRLPTSVVTQMLLNVGLEFLVGTVPLVGDAFDAFFKSNVRNLALLEKHLEAVAPDLQDADILDLHSVQQKELDVVGI